MHVKAIFFSFRMKNLLFQQQSQEAELSYVLLVVEGVNGAEEQPVHVHAMQDAMHLVGGKAIVLGDYILEKNIVMQVYRTRKLKKKIFMLLENIEHILNEFLVFERQ